MSLFVDGLAVWAWSGGTVCVRENERLGWVVDGWVDIVWKEGVMCRGGGTSDTLFTHQYTRFGEA